MNTTWKTNTEYKVLEAVYIWGQKFVCMKDHKSTVFCNDYQNEQKWYYEHG